MSKPQTQELKCFVIDCVTFIGLFTPFNPRPSAVAVLGIQPGEDGSQITVGAISPYMDIGFDPEFSSGSMERAIKFTPSPSVIGTYLAFQTQLAERLEQRAKALEEDDGPVDFQKGKEEALEDDDQQELGFDEESE